MDMMEFVEGLTPEQKERFKTCRGASDIVAFAKAEKLSLPDDLLEKVAGGEMYSKDLPYFTFCCPHCGTTKQNEFVYLDTGTFVCLECGRTFGPKY